MKKSELEAEVVEAFVEGRTLVNNGSRLQRRGKRYFEAQSRKKNFKGYIHKIKIVYEDKMGFDFDAFIAEYGQAVYDKFYRPKKCVTYVVSQIKGK